MKGLAEIISGRRLWSLFLKELRQLRRNRRLVVMLVIPPTINLVLFGLALNPEVHDLRLGVVDESRTAESRELVSAMAESRSFAVGGYYASSDELGRALAAGDLDAGLVIPYDLAKRRARRETAEVQLLVDAVNTNTATIAGGYAARIISALDRRLADGQGPSVARQVQSRATNAMTSADDTTVAAGANSSPSAVAQPQTSVRVTGLARADVTPRVALLYNPGLRNSWFIVTGLIGTLLLLQGSLVSAASLVREKEAGTIEQLLMTPAGASEIVVAKVAPVLILLSANIGLALAVGYLVFGVPVRGSLALLYSAGMLCVLSGIGIGTFIATFTRSQQQAQLMAFFVNPPIAMLSGAMTPVEAMPRWLQPVTYLNPVRHFGVISRGVMLKGVGLDVLYPHLLALVCFAAVLVGVSAWRFRKQLG